ncbi:MAG: hypothetical protein ACR2M0_04100 [Chloroflexia bacterium]
MANYTGAGRVDYEDLLRAIGHFIDEHSFKEVYIIEIEEGILVRGLVNVADPQGFRTISEAYLFTNTDIAQILEEAHQRRGKPRNMSPHEDDILPGPAHSLGATYPAQSSNSS